MSEVAVEGVIYFQTLETNILKNLLRKFYFKIWNRNGFLNIESLRKLSNVLGLCKRIISRFSCIYTAQDRDAAPRRHLQELLRTSTVGYTVSNSQLKRKKKAFKIWKNSLKSCFNK